MLALAPDLLVYSYIGSWKSLVFVVASSFVLYLAVGWLQTKAHNPATNLLPDIDRGALILVFALLACSIVLVGLGGVAYTANNQKKQEVERLRAIADLKSGQIAAWLTERWNDAIVLRGDTVLSDLYATWRRSGNQANRAKLAEKLEIYRNAFNYQNILLIDENGNVVEAHSGAKHPSAPILIDTVRRAIETGEIQLTDLYRMHAPASSHVHLDFVTPLQTAEGEAGLAAVLRIDPYHFLFPFIQSWPVPSASAETLLFRRDGDAVLFLNELRYRSDTALKFRMPMTTSDLLAVQALEGRATTEGVVEGVDYRSVPVLGVVKPIEGTAWHLVAKLDKNELYAQAKKEAGWIALVGTLAVVIAAAAVGLIYQRQELRFSQAQRRQQAEKLQALQLLDAIVDGSTNAIYAKDAAGRYLLVNRELSRFVGKTESEMLNRDDTAFFQPVDAERLMKSDRDVMNADHVATTEEMLRTLGGVRTFLTTRGPLHDAEGQVIGLFGIAQDITERKHQEREIRASEAKLRAIFDGVNDAIFLHDAETGAIIDVNTKMTEMYGYDRQSARQLSMSMLSADSQPFSDECAEKWFASANAGETPVFEWLARRRDGTHFWVEMSMRRVRFFGHACILVFARGIEDRKKVEGILQEQAKLLELIGMLSLAVEQCPISIVITDAAGNIEYVNLQLTEVTGYSEQDLIGRNLCFLRSSHAPTDEQWQLWKTIASGQEWSGAIQNRRKNGELFWENERILPVRDANGRIANFLVIKNNSTAW